MEYPEEYVASRAVLLDALTALDSHLSILILVGAQAVYLHTEASDLSQPPMTTDADLALDTSALADEPEISGALRSAGFVPGKNPGSWLGMGNVAVDVMVVPWQSGTQKKGARAGRIPPHERQTARITPGLEPAIVDNALRPLTAFDPTDDRDFEVNVAGPAALMIAKAIKIEERLADADSGHSARLKEKDALDVFRLLQAVETVDLVQGINLHLTDEHAREISLRGLRVLMEHGSAEDAQLPMLATRAASGDPTIAVSFAALTTQFLDATKLA